MTPRVLALPLVLALCAGCRSAGSAPSPLPRTGRPPQPAAALKASAPAAPSAAAWTPLRAGPEHAPRAEEEQYVWPRLSLSLGLQLIADVNTTLRVDSETLGAGTEIDLENDFDVDDSLVLGRIDAGWRFARKHSLDFSLFRLDRKGTRITDRDIQIGDEVFPVNSEVTSEFETTVIKLAYRYAFLDRPRWHLGASLGAHTMDWKTKWTAGTLALEESFDFIVPLPVLGLFGSYAFTPKLYLNASSEFFGLEYEEFDGFMNNSRLNVEHRTFEHLAFGLGVEYFLIDASVESESGNLSADAEYDYLGVLVFARLL